MKECIDCEYICDARCCDCNECKHFLELGNIRFCYECIEKDICHFELKSEQECPTYSQTD